MSKKWMGFLLAGATLAGCGGGSGGSSTAAPAVAQEPSVVTQPSVTSEPPVTTQPPVTEPPVTAPPPVPAMALQSGPVARVVAAGTSVNIEISAKASNFTPTSTLYAGATDSAGVIQATAQVTANGDANYTFALDTSRILSAGRYAGNATITLCSDQACNTPLAGTSFSVPYDVTVLASGSAWPGDKLSTLSALSGVPDWSTFQGNAAHTGYVPIDVAPDQMFLRWKRGAVNTASGGYNGTLPVLATADGMFYASGSNKLTAYKEHDGSQVWSYDFSGLTYPSVNPPAVSGGVVYVAAGQQSSTNMFAFDATSGTLRFRSPMSSQWENYMAPVVSNNAVYTNAGTYGGIYGFNSTGERLFFSSLSQTSVWSPAADARAIYAYTGDALTMFDPQTGARLASIADDSFSNYTYEVRGSAVLGANGGVYAANYANAFLNGGTMGNSLMRFDSVKGFLDWRIQGNYVVTPAYAGGVLYAANTNPYRIEARAEADGRLLWSWTPPVASETTFHGSPVVTNKLLFVSTNTNTYAIDLRSHNVVWSYPAGGHLAISQNGLLYIQNTSALVAINMK